LLFRSRGEFVEAILAALAGCRAELTLADRDFSDWPLESPQGVELLARVAAAPHARIRVLVADPDWLERRAPRFVALRRRHAAAIQCRRIPPALANGEGVLIADRLHLVRRARATLFRGRLSLADPAAAEPMAARYDALWDESEPCLPAAPLGL